MFLIFGALTNCWFLSSTDRRIRDQATKAITAILLKKSNIAIKLLQKFQNCDDEYIKERLLFAIYGALLLNRSCDSAHEVSKFLFDNYCNTEQWPLNVSIREHISLIVELALSLDSSKLEINEDEIQALVSKVSPVINFSTDLEKPKFDKRKTLNIDVETMLGLTSSFDFVKYEIQPRIRKLLDLGFSEFDYSKIENGFLNGDN